MSGKTKVTRGHFDSLMLEATGITMHHAEAYREIAEFGRHLLRLVGAEIDDLPDIQTAAQKFFSSNGLSSVSGVDKATPSNREESNDAMLEAAAAAYHTEWHKEWLSVRGEALQLPPAWDDLSEHTRAATKRCMDAALAAASEALDKVGMNASDYEEVLADHRRLVRELDVALNGEAGAAKQATLGDIVAQVKREHLWLYRTTLPDVDDGIGWIALTDDDRAAAMRTMPNALEGFMKTWGWLNFAHEIEQRCMEKNRRHATTVTQRDSVLEEAARMAEKVGRPVGAGDGCGTYVPGTSADAARAIRALMSRAANSDTLPNCALARAAEVTDAEIALCTIAEFPITGQNQDAHNMRAIAIAASTGHLHSPRNGKLPRHLDTVRDAQRWRAIEDCLTSDELIDIGLTVAGDYGLSQKWIYNRPVGEIIDAAIAVRARSKE